MWRVIDAVARSANYLYVGPSGGRRGAPRRRVDGVGIHCSHYLGAATLFGNAADGV